MRVHNGQSIGFQELLFPLLRIPRALSCLSINVGVPGRDHYSIQFVFEYSRREFDSQFSLIYLRDFLTGRLVSVNVVWSRHIKSISAANDFTVIFLFPCVSPTGFACASQRVSDQTGFCLISDAPLPVRVWTPIPYVLSIFPFLSIFAFAIVSAFVSFLSQIYGLFDARFLCLTHTRNWFNILISHVPYFTRTEQHNNCAIQNASCCHEMCKAKMRFASILHEHRILSDKIHKSKRRKSTADRARVYVSRYLTGPANACLRPPLVPNAVVRTRENRRCLYVMVFCYFRSPTSIEFDFFMYTIATSVVYFYIALNSNLRRIDDRWWKFCYL